MRAVPPRPAPSMPPALDAEKTEPLPRTKSEKLLHIAGVSLIWGAALLFLLAIIMALVSVTVLAFFSGVWWFIGALVFDAFVLFCMGCFVDRMSEPN